MKKVLSVVIAIVLTFCLFGCGDRTTGSSEYAISGRVVSSTGGGVAGVSLKIGGEVVTTTDADGKYSISDLIGKKQITPVLNNYKISPAEINVSYPRDDADFNAAVIPEVVPDPEPVPPPVAQDTWPILEDEVVFDGFDNGIDYNKWDIVSKKWGLNKEFQGTTASNVGYTEDGVAILGNKGRNYYNSSEKNTTACLITKEAMGPGRYDIVAKIAPRLGVCSAIWLFYYETIEGATALNQEIDILETPGQNANGQDLNYVMNTNYTHDAPSPYAHHVQKVPTPNNDGEWHKYSIEWSVKGDENGRYIKYYTDDVLTHTARTYVPTYKMQLWIGTWMPASTTWIGEPDYEQMDMLVDRVSYKSFNETAADGVKEPDPNFIEKKVASIKSFPTAPKTIENYDYISNGSFSGVESAWSRSGNPGSHVISLDYLALEQVYRMKEATTVRQRINAMYEGFTFDFSIKGRRFSDIGELKVKIEYINKDGSQVIGTPIEHIFAKGDNYDLFKTKLTVPKNGMGIRVSLISTAGTLGYIDDVSMMRTFGDAV